MRTAELDFLHSHFITDWLPGCYVKVWKVCVSSCKGYPTFVNNKTYAKCLWFVLFRLHVFWCWSLTLRWTWHCGFCPINEMLSTESMVAYFIWYKKWWWVNNFRMFMTERFILNCYALKFDIIIVCTHVSTRKMAFITCQHSQLPPKYTRL